MIVAGGRIGGTLASETGTWTKGLVQIGGTRCVESAVLALRACPLVEQVLVVCDPALRRDLGSLPVDGWVHERPRGFENFFAALHYLPRDRPCLLCVSDMPFAHLGDLGPYLAACAPEAAVNYGITRREDFLRIFPGSPRRFVPMREGNFTGGGLALVDPLRFLTTEAVFRQLFESRKNTLPIALKLGPGFLLRRLLGWLTIPEVECRLSDIVGVPCRAIPACDPHFAFDVDTAADHRYATAWLNGRDSPV